MGPPQGVPAGRGKSIVRNLLKYLAARFATYLAVLFIGITIVFILPRLMPSDPIDNYLTNIQARAGQTLTAEQVAEIRAALVDLYGLKGSIWDQYLGYLKRVFLTFDFGPSLSGFPKPVTEFIADSLPWTLGLLSTATVISWTLGNLIGLIAGFYHHRKFAAVVETIGVLIYPIPYYIFALAMIILFAFLLPIFPLTTTIMPGPLTLQKILTILSNSVLPAMALVLAGFGWNILGMKALAFATKEESYVLYAHLKGVPSHKIMTSYVFRNAILPQVTALALSLGTIFSGALITEMLFSYPGMGMLMRRAIGEGDYNLLYGTISVTIVAVATATLVIDLLYPFFDPRIRHR